LGFAKGSSLFRFNEILIISDGIEARAGTNVSKREIYAMENN